jgi:hypothetical protein
MVRADSPFFAETTFSVDYLTCFFPSMLNLLRPLGLLFTTGLLVSNLTAQAQMAAPAGAIAAHGYDFLTLTSMESGSKVLAKILIVPAFQGKSEIQMEDFGGFSAEKNLAKLQHNTELIQQQLSELTVAGWELVQTYPFISSPNLVTTRYLFRKAKN